MTDDFKKEICTCKDAAYGPCNVCPKNKDLTEQLRVKGSDGSMFGYSPLYDKAANRIEKLEAEVERLKNKCDLQATILQHLSPDKYPNLPFIHGTIGEKDQNGMPEKLMVIPAIGVDFSYIYAYTNKVTGPEW